MKRLEKQFSAALALLLAASTASGQTPPPITIIDTSTVSTPITDDTPYSLEVDTDVPWTHCYWALGSEQRCEQVAPDSGAGNVQCKTSGNRYNTITGGSYSPNKCRLEFFNFEAEDSGDWKVVVAINGIVSVNDEFTFNDVFATRQADLRIEDPTTGDRDDRLTVQLGVPFSRTCNAVNGRPETSSFEWTFDGDLIVDGQAEFNVDLSGIDSHPDNNGSNFGYPPSVTQTLVMTLPTTTSTNREYSLRCSGEQNGGDFAGLASDAITIVPTEGGDENGLTSAEIALVVICVLIVVIFVALAAFLYCTGRLIGCGIGGDKKTKKKTDPGADAKKRTEAEKRLRDIRLAEARRLERDRLEKQQQRWAEPEIAAGREEGFMTADLPGFAPAVDRTKKPPLLTLAIAPPGKLESGFQTSSSLSYTPSPSSPSGGVYTIGGGSPLPHNGSYVIPPTTRPSVPYQGHSPVPTASSHRHRDDTSLGELHFSASYPRSASHSPSAPHPTQSKQYRDDGRGFLV